LINLTAIKVDDVDSEVGFGNNLKDWRAMCRHVSTV